MTRRSQASRRNKLLKEAQANFTSMIMRNFPYALFHEKCGKVAFYLSKMPEEGMPLNPEDAIYPNGDMPQKNTNAICGSCREQLYHGDLNPANVRRIELRAADIIAGRVN